MPVKSTTSPTNRPPTADVEGRWSYEEKHLKILDKYNAPMVCHVKVSGVVDDDLGGGDAFAKAGRAATKAIIFQIKKHVHDSIGCKDHKDAHHDFAGDLIKGGPMTRGQLLMKVTRSQVRPMGRTIASYDLKSLRAAPVEWSGRCLQFIPFADEEEEVGEDGEPVGPPRTGIWRARLVSIDREGVLTMVTVKAEPGEISSGPWFCAYCNKKNEATEGLCGTPGCGGRKKGESRGDSRRRGNDEARAGKGAAMGDEDVLTLDSKNLCAVQAVEHSHGRADVVVVTLNKLPHGTVFNSPAHHRGPGLVKPAGAPPADEDNLFSGKDNGVTKSLIFSCKDTATRRALYAAFLNSTAPVLPSVSVLGALSNAAEPIVLTYAFLFAPLLFFGRGRCGGRRSAWTS